MTEFYSQAGQDAWVVEQHPEPGFFVDVGAYDGVEHSNTYALERDNGWRGFGIEPNRAASERYLANRTTPVITCAVSDFNGLIGFDGIHVDHRRFVDDPASELPDGGPIPDFEQLIECRTLAYLLADWNGPIGYLSIDAEGEDLRVLQGHDFDRWPVRLITVEHNLYLEGPARKDAIYAFLTERGFERVAEDVVAPGYGPYEDWFVYGCENTTSSNA